MISFINENELENSIKKLRMYKNSLNLTFEEIMKKLNNLNYEYETSNKQDFNDKKIDFLNKEKVINNIYNGNIYVIEKTIINYKEISKLVEKRFDDII